MDLRIHPVHLLDDEDRLLLELWRAWRGPPAFAPVGVMGMGGGMIKPVEVGRLGGALPFAGGSAEQPSCVMDALLVMEAAASRLKATPRPEED